MVPHRGPSSPVEGTGPAPAFRNPAVTVDGVIVHRAADSLRVLLIRRGNEPFRGRHALPGGFVEYGEDLLAAVRREVAEETGLADLDFRQLGAFGRPGRDPRGHTVSIAFTAVIEGPVPRVLAGDDAEHAAWFDVGNLPELAFDHGEILAQALAALPRP